MSDQQGSKSTVSPGKVPSKPVLKLSAFLPYRLNHLAETVSRSFSRIYADTYGIGIPEWRVLATLGEYKAMTARDISQATSMHKTKVSRAIFVEQRIRKLRSLDCAHHTAHECGDSTVHAVVVAGYQPGQQVYVCSTR